MLLLLPCLIPWVLKTPWSVAVCLERSWFVNLTVVPVTTTNFPGRNLKFLIVTAPPARSAPLADAGSPPRLQPSRRAAASAIAAIAASAAAARRWLPTPGLIELVLRTPDRRGSTARTRLPDQPRLPQPGRRAAAAG